MNDILNLDIHDPEEYTGKFITCNNCEYVIGEFLGEGADRIVHRLHNCKTRLDLHVVKVVKQIDPPRPKGYYTKEIAQLRSVAELAKVIPITIECEIPGGLVELQQNVDKSKDNGISNFTEGQKAIELLKTEKYTAAIEAFDEILCRNQLSTSVLMNLAISHANSGDMIHASMYAERAVSYEPNLFWYWSNLLTFTASAGELYRASIIFEKIKSNFENVYDLDSYGAGLFIDIDKPETALKYVATSTLSEADKEIKINNISISIDQRRKATEYLSIAKKFASQRDWQKAYETLVNATDTYDKSVYVNINMALCMYKFDSKNRNEAIRILFYNSYLVNNYFKVICIANAAFISTLDSNYDIAEIMFSKTAMALIEMTGGSMPDHLADLPGVASWVEQDSIIEERLETTRDVVCRFIQHKPIEKLSDKYIISLMNAYSNTYIKA